MNKNELVSAVATRENITKDQATSAVDSVFDVISRELRSGGEVAVKGFGTLIVKIRASRMGRNPKTGESIQIPEKKVVKFRASPGLIG